MLHVGLCHVAHTNEASHTYKHVTHINVSCHTRRTIQQQIWMKHVARMIVSCTIMSHVCTKYVTRMNWSCHTHQTVQQHTNAFDETHMNVSCHTYMNAPYPTTQTPCAILQKVHTFETRHTTFMKKSHRTHLWKNHIIHTTLNMMYHSRYTHVNEDTPQIWRSLVMNMGWLRLVGSSKLQVSFAKEPYQRDDVLPKRRIIWRSLLTVATPYQWVLSHINETHQIIQQQICTCEERRTTDMSESCHTYERVMLHI